MGLMDYAIRFQVYFGIGNGHLSTIRYFVYIATAFKLFSDSIIIGAFFGFAYVIGSVCLGIIDRKINFTGRTSDFSKFYFDNYAKRLEEKIDDVRNTDNV